MGSNNFNDVPYEDDDCDNYATESSVDYIVIGVSIIVLLVLLGLYNK